MEREGVRSSFLARGECEERKSDERKEMKGGEGEEGEEEKGNGGTFRERNTFWGGNRGIV
jgi:hypothetical protein